jgi:hypothetical protein
MTYLNLAALICTNNNFIKRPLMLEELETITGPVPAQTFTSRPTGPEANRPTDITAAFPFNTEPAQDLGSLLESPSNGMCNLLHNLQSFNSFQR